MLLPGSRSSCKINPTLQLEQRLQKYANTNPLRVQKAEPRESFEEEALIWFRPDFTRASTDLPHGRHLAPGPESDRPRAPLRCSQGASLIVRLRPASSLPLRSAMAVLASISSAISTNAKPRGSPVPSSLTS